MKTQCAHDHRSTGNIQVAFFLNLGFTLFEVAGGLATNSLAVLSDAVHDAGDSVSLGLSWYLEKKSKRGSDPLFTYGYGRFSPLGALVAGLVLVGGLALVLARAVPRLLAPEPVHAPGMIALALFGIAVNGAAAWKASRGTSLNEGMVGWHLLEDALGWVAVLFGSIAMAIWNLPIIDPLLSVGIALFVLFNVVRNLKKVVQLFLQRVPEGFDRARFERNVLDLPHMKSLHHTHSWTLDGEHHVLSTHLVMAPHTPRPALLETKDAVRTMLTDQGFSHVTIEVELEGEACPTRHRGQSSHSSIDDG